MKFTLVLFLLIFIFSIYTGYGLENQWLSSLDEAIKLSQKDNRDILVDFSGSDWCGWCMKLDNEVFSKKAWIDYAKDNMIMVQIDFPRKNNQSEQQIRYNRTLQKKYKISGYPTVLLFNSKGNLYARTGYNRGGPEAYISMIKKFQKRKDFINKLSDNFDSLSEEKQAENYKKIWTKLSKWQITQYYTEFLDKGIKFDKDNKYGIKLDFSIEYYKIMIENKNEKKAKKYFNIIKKLSPQKAESLTVQKKAIGILKNSFSTKDFDGAIKKLDKLVRDTKDPEASQNVKFLTANIYYRQGKLKETIKCLNQAKEIAPNSKIASTISNLIEKLSKIKKQR